MLYVNNSTKILLLITFFFLFLTQVSAQVDNSFSEFQKGLYVDVNPLYKTNVTIGTIGDYVKISNSTGGIESYGIYQSYAHRNGSTANDIKAVVWNNINWTNYSGIAPNGQAHPVRSSMSCYLKLDGNANDEKGCDSGSAGTVVWQSDCVFGGCANFTANENNYVYINDSPPVDADNRLSYELWVKTTTANRGMIMAKASDTGEGYYLAISEGKAEVFFVDYAGYNVTLISTATINDGQWHHIAVTKGYDTPVKLYIDGLLDSVGGVFGGGINNGLSLKFGRSDHSTPYPYDGLVDQFIIYNNIELPEEEIRESYARGVADLNISLRWRISNVTREVYNTSGLVAWYKFENNSLDSSGNGNDGILMGEGTQNKSGYFGYAYDFNGSGYVEVADSDSLDLTGQFTLEAWINLRPSAQTDRPIVEKINFVNGGFAMRLVFNSLVGAIAEGPSYEYCLTEGIVTDYVWHHVAVTYNNETNTLKCYVDGKLEGQISTTLVMTPSTAPLRIASAGWDNTILTNGTIDSVRIYNRELSAEEIKWNYWHADFANSTWSNWNDDGFAVVDQVGKYFQYEANLSTNNTLYTPFLESVTIVYDTVLLLINEIFLLPNCIQKGSWVDLTYFVYNKIEIKENYCNFTSPSGNISKITLSKTSYMHICRLNFVNETGIWNYTIFVSDVLNNVAQVNGSFEVKKAESCGIISGETISFILFVIIATFLAFRKEKIINIIGSLLILLIGINLLIGFWEHQISSTLGFIFICLAIYKIFKEALS